MPDDESDRVEKAYGANYRGLADQAFLRPQFRMNQNIRPSEQVIA
jgi:hypothetical protein